MFSRSPGRQKEWLLVLLARLVLPISAATQQELRNWLSIVEGRANFTGSSQSLLEATMGSNEVLVVGCTEAVIQGDICAGQCTVLSLPNTSFGCLMVKKLWPTLPNYPNCNGHLDFGFCRTPNLWSIVQQPGQASGPQPSSSQLPGPQTSHSHSQLAPSASSEPPSPSASLPSSSFPTNTRSSSNDNLSASTAPTLSFTRGFLSVAVPAPSDLEGEQPASKNNGPTPRAPGGKLSVGSIIGVVFGILAAIVAIVALTVFLSRWRKHRRESKAGALRAEPFEAGDFMTFASALPKVRSFKNPQSSRRNSSTVAPVEPESRQQDVPSKAAAFSSSIQPDDDTTAPDREYICPTSPACMVINHEDSGVRITSMNDRAVYEVVREHPPPYTAGQMIGDMTELWDFFVDIDLF